MFVAVSVLVVELNVFPSTTKDHFVPRGSPYCWNGWFAVGIVIVEEEDVLVVVDFIVEVLVVVLFIVVMEIVLPHICCPTPPHCVKIGGVETLTSFASLVTKAAFVASKPDTTRTNSIMTDATMFLVSGLI